LTALFIILFLVVVINDTITKEPQADRAEAALLSEFAQVTPLPQATQVEHYSVSKNTALVGAKYRTNLDYDQIREHYEYELARLGWVRTKVEHYEFRGEDLGGINVCYQKGEYSAVLQYAGDKSAWPWTYALDLTWGSKSCSDSEPN
jgi:hypothetical protein